MYCAIDGFAGGVRSASAAGARARAAAQTHAMSNAFGIRDPTLRYRASMAAQPQTVDVPVAAASRAIAARQWVVRVVTGGVTFWLAYENGSYAEPTRHAISIAVWWGVIVALVAGIAKTKRALGDTVAVGLSLAAFAAWTLASVTWAADPESAFSEFDRVSLYLGVFVLCSALFRRRDLAAWCDGIGFGIGAVGVLALVSRTVPRRGRPPGRIDDPAGAHVAPELPGRLLERARDPLRDGAAVAARVHDGRAARVRFARRPRASCRCSRPRSTSRRREAQSRPRSPPSWRSCS